MPGDTRGLEISPGELGCWRRTLSGEKEVVDLVGVRCEVVQLVGRPVTRHPGVDGPVGVKVSRHELRVQANLRRNVRAQHQLRCPGSSAWGSNGVPAKFLPSSCCH